MNLPDVEQLIQKLREGDRRALAQAITLVESSRPDHRLSAVHLLKSITPYSGSAFRIGISGVPGVGKSTFIEVFGNHALRQGARLAVLTVDPSSPISGGSILGDKTRMESLVRQEEVFIRPSAAGGTLGGVTKRTRETLLLCEAAGFNLILVETVGIGQSETAVAQMTDMFILLLLPGGGDDLQGIKRGVTELADLILINKSDGSLAKLAQNTAAEYQNALQFLQPRTEGWSVLVKTCSAMENRGVEEVWETIENYRDVMNRDDRLRHRRGQQAKSWFWDEVSELLVTKLKRHPKIKSHLRRLEQDVLTQKIPPTVAAEELADKFIRVEDT